MKCPFCAAVDTKVIDKRPTPDNIMNRRRRECIKCSKRFTTYEQVQNLGLCAIKKDGSEENFVRDKIKNGILKACEKRPISEEKIDAIVDWIEQKARKNKSSKIKTSHIGELVLKKLKTMDEVAYIRFASVCRSFDDIKSFEKELKTLKTG